MGLLHQTWYPPNEMLNKKHEINTNSTNIDLDADNKITREPNGNDQISQKEQQNLYYVSNKRYYNYRIINNCYKLNNNHYSCNSSSSCINQNENDGRNECTMPDGKDDEFYEDSRGISYVTNAVNGFYRFAYNKVLREVATAAATTVTSSTSSIPATPTKSTGTTLAGTSIVSIKPTTVNYARNAAASANSHHKLIPIQSVLTTATDAHNRGHKQSSGSGTATTNQQEQQHAVLNDTDLTKVAAHSASHAALYTSLDCDNKDKKVQPILGGKKLTNLPPTITSSLTYTPSSFPTGATSAAATASSASLAAVLPLPTELPQEDEERLEKLFNRLDRDGNGRIDIHDLSEALREFGLSSVYAEVSNSKYAFTISKPIYVFFFDLFYCCLCVEILRAL